MTNAFGFRFNSPIWIAQLIIGLLINNVVQYNEALDLGKFLQNIKKYYFHF